jgi:8-oxo-dGTP diphosphatase
VARDGWVGSHDDRPLAELGTRQAEALAPVIDLAELCEAGDFGAPTAGVDEIPELMVRALGGAWAAGRMLRAVALMMDAHPGGRAVAASHGDVVPVLLAALAGASGMPRPRHVGRGGWYTLQFASGDLAIISHDPVAV